MFAAALGSVALGGGHLPQRTPGASLIVIGVTLITAGAWPASFLGRADSVQ